MRDGDPRWLVVLVVLLTLVWGASAWRRLRRTSAVLSDVRPSRRWHPRTPDDCPCCRLAVSDCGRQASEPPSVRPWVEIKSRRGAPKRRPTAGYACPTPTCPYFGIADERLHALIAYGYHGASERIPDLYCQACGTKFTARHGTALYHLKTRQPEWARCSVPWLRASMSARRCGCSATGKPPSRGG
jgi:hypothetical protein